jgi:hypothetical protein
MAPAPSILDLGLWLGFRGVVVLCGECMGCYEPQVWQEGSADYMNSHPVRQENFSGDLLYSDGRTDWVYVTCNKAMVNLCFWRGRLLSTV